MPRLTRTQVIDLMKRSGFKPTEEELTQALADIDAQHDDDTTTNGQQDDEGTDTKNIGDDPQ